MDNRAFLDLVTEVQRTLNETHEPLERGDRVLVVSGFYHDKRGRVCHVGFMVEVELDRLSRHSFYREQLRRISIVDALAELARRG